MTTITKFNTASIILTILLVIVIIVAVLLSIRQKKKGKSCCGECNGCTLCKNNERFDLNNITIKPLSKAFYKRAIDILEIQKSSLCDYKSGQKYIFYKALSHATETKGVYINNKLEGFAIFKRANNPLIKNYLVKPYVFLKELSKPFRNYALSLKEKEESEKEILLIAVNPLTNPDKLIELLLN